MTRWRITTNKKQYSQLPKTREFFGNFENLVAVELITPISSEKVKNLVEMGNISSDGIVCFEIWWNQAKFDLKLVVISDQQEIERIKNQLQLIYPNIRFRQLDNLIPEGQSTSAKNKAFDVSLRHAQFFTPFDTQNNPTLITDICSMIQQTEFAWIQFAFCSVNLIGQLNPLTNRLAHFYKETQSDYYGSTTEMILNNLVGNKIKKRAHPEKYGEFTNNYSGLQKLLEIKKQNPQAILQVRGLYRSNIPLQLPFHLIDSMPIGNGLKIDYCQQYDFDVKHLKNYEKKKNLITCNDVKNVFVRYEIFPRRLLCLPDKHVKHAVSHYVSKKWFGGYYARKPLPFLILNLNELFLFVHLPNSVISNLKTTRIQNLPQHLPDKDVFSLGDAI